MARDIVIEGVRIPDAPDNADTPDKGALKEEAHHPGQGDQRPDSHPAPLLSVE